MHRKEHIFQDQAKMIPRFWYSCRIIIYNEMALLIKTWWVYYNEERLPLKVKNVYLKKHDDNHRLTYSHSSWMHRIRMLLKVFVFLLFFWGEKILILFFHCILASPCVLCMTPTSSSPLYPILGLKIRVSTEIRVFSRHPNLQAENRMQGEVRV